MIKLNKENIKNYLKKSKISIILIIAFLLLAYGQRLISTAFSIDTELYINDYIGIASWWNNLGRWGLVLINKCFSIGPLVIFHSNYFMLIFLILSSIAYNYLIYINLPKKYQETFIKYQFIFPIIFFTSPIFAEQFNFTNQNFAVSLCMFLIPLILITYQEKAEMTSKMARNILEVVNLTLLTIIFATYQSLILLYIASVAVIYFIKCLMEKDSNIKWLITNIIRFAISAIVYIIIGKIVGEGNSYLQTGYSSGIRIVANNIYNVVVSMLKCETIFYNMSFLIAIIFAAVIIIILIKEKRINVGSILGAIGMALAPFYIMIITGTDQLKRTQFNYSFIIGITFILLVLLLSNYKKMRYLIYPIVILGIMIAYKQGMVTATLFAGDNVRFEYDKRFAEKIVEKIEEKEWYEKDKEYKLIIVGKESTTSALQPLKGEVIGHSFFEFDYQYHYGPSHRATTFINELGYNNFKEAENNELAKSFEESKKYVKKNKIKAFPSDDSIIKKDKNIIIVRLSDEID